MEEFINKVDELPLWLKIVLSLPVLDWFWAVYRLIYGISKNSVSNIVLGIVWLVFGGWILCIVDIIYFALYKKVLVLS